MMFLAGMPLMFLELSFGQYAGQGPITIWKACPAFYGIGWSMVVISGLVAIYYNVIMAWTALYFVKSFAFELPWKSCKNSWNSLLCGYKNDDGLYINGTWYNQSSLDEMGFNRPEGNLLTPAEEYWNKVVLQHEGYSMEDIGPLNWQLVLALLFAWIVVFGCICKGIKSSGKVVYFTATFPYVILTVLLIRGVTLEGAGDGIIYYLSPRWENIKKASVWNDAAVQIFYSMGPAWGGVLTMASYNKFHNNCLRDAILVPIINCSTSFFAGFVVFSTLGFISRKTGTDLEDLSVSGPGLVFITYPEAIAQMPVAPLWSVLFFAMLFLVGLDTQFGMVETVISGIIDRFPRLLRNHKTKVAFSICSLFFVIGLPIVTKGGIYWFELINWYSCWISLMMVGMMECIAISWFYGIQRFLQDIRAMLGRYPIVWPWYAACWLLITPGIILFISIFGLVQYVPVYYGDYVYPVWAEVVGWIMAAAPLVMMPLIAVGMFIFKAEGSILQRLRFIITPSPDWGPQQSYEENGVKVDISQDTRL
ncbi:Sodium- and chloride-dependent glycine transporter 2 [Holothuria leucospilota]|uniref:Sodium- and chloride-dependent glycine transporter 2 n=1 Tax=Holothuria leucospilota TaxID=206669 RepID=A0A9Q1BLL0_HOLLE|nr:Sodium- and chloride-dependent glycine transporter 2 [Holothuria leucospilota]